MTVLVHHVVRYALQNTAVAHQNRATGRSSAMFLHFNAFLVPTPKDSNSRLGARPHQSNIADHSDSVCLMVVLFWWTHFSRRMKLMNP